MAYLFGEPMPDETFTVKVSGMEFKMNFKGAECCRELIMRIQGIREPKTTEILRRLVKPGMKVIELGACFGYFTMILSKLVRESGRILAAEPVGSNADILCRNLRVNKATNVRVLRLCINNDPAYAGIYNRDGVPVRRITEVIQELHFHPDLIFMDIEGSEAHVIKDLVESGYLKSHRPKIIWEAHSELCKGSGHWWDFAELLKGYGYESCMQGRHMVVAIARKT